MPSARSWPSFRLVPPESLSRARSSLSSRVHVPGSSTVRGCPAVTDGLDGELARLQDRGTGGMASLATPRASAGLRRCVRLAALRVGREPGAAVARQGLRAAGPAAGSVPGSAKVPSQLRTVDAPRRAVLSSRGALACAAANPRGALRAPLKPLEKVLTRQWPSRCAVPLDA